MIQKIKTIAKLPKKVSELEKRAVELEKKEIVLMQKIKMYEKTLDDLERENGELQAAIIDLKNNADKNERKLKKQQKEEQKKIKQIPAVMEATGWDWETASMKMERAKKIAGSSYEHYVIYRFWELTEEEQKTYFTKKDMRRLWKKYNTDPQILETLMNKDLCCKKLGEYLGRPWLSTEGMTFESFAEKFGGESKIIYKPRASTQGRGIRVFDIDPGNTKSVYEQICELPKGILEGYLVQHPEMKKLSLNSVNTVRIVTISTQSDNMGIEKDKVHFLYAGVRMGQGNSIVDNLHSGGLMAAVNIETGIVETGGVDHLNNVYQKHPNTDAEIVGFKIPFFAEAKQMIEKASKDLPGYFGWDIAITENGPVIVEVNTSPGADGLQTPYVPEKRGMRYVIEKYL